jgi:alpha-beta hydrolase superfamily lysophospholipase
MEPMPGHITESEFFFPSADGKTQVRALLWEPDPTEASSIKGILQIAHGMAEHIERYRDFAKFLANNGYIVCANDHIAHGKSVSTRTEWGCLPKKGGMDILLADIHELRILTTKRYLAHLPYIALGHSMGSFIVRAYCAKYWDGLSAAILSGTGQQPATLSSVGNLAARFIATFRGAAYKSKFLDSLGVGAYAKAIDNPRTPLDWLSHNTDNVDAYLADPASGFMFSAGGYATLTELTGFIVSRTAAENTPKDLPMLFVAGADDPVGNKGAGVQQAVDQLKKAGVEKVDLILYENMRHEILNETNREQVYQDILNWLAGVLR